MQSYHKIELFNGITDEAIIQELLHYSLPVVIPLTSETKPLLQALPVKSHALAFYDVAGSDEVFLDTILTVAPQFKGR
jgi:hypothetical protein